MITFVFDDDEFVKMYKFRTQDNHIILVEEFSDGIATIRPTEEYRNLEEFADVISGCLDKRSNFVSKLMEVYACKEDEEFKGLILKIIGISVFIPPEEITGEQIIRIIEKGIKDLCEADLRYTIDTEFKVKLCDFVTSIYYDTSMEFSSTTAEKMWKRESAFLISYERGNRIFDYVETFAKYAQYLVEVRKKEFSDAFSYTLEDIEQVVWVEPEEQERAMDLLIKYWKYGQELVEWHRQIIAEEMQSVIDEL